MRQNMLCLAQRDLCGTCAGQAGRLRRVWRRSCALVEPLLVRSCGVKRSGATTARRYVFRTGVRESEGVTKTESYILMLKSRNIAHGLAIQHPR